VKAVLKAIPQSDVFNAGMSLTSIASHRIILPGWKKSICAGGRCARQAYIMTTLDLLGRDAPVFVLFGLAVLFPVSECMRA